MNPIYNEINDTEISRNAVITLFDTTFSFFKSPRESDGWKTYNLLVELIREFGLWSLYKRWEIARVNDPDSLENFMRRTDNG